MIQFVINICSVPSRQSIKVLSKVRYGILGGVLMAATIMLAACPSTNGIMGSISAGGNAGSGNSGDAGSNTGDNGGDNTGDNGGGAVIYGYVCANGTPVAEKDATADNITRCRSCKRGYLLNANKSCTNDLDADGVLNVTDVDDDNNGLIEVSTLEMLHNMRFDLAGASYKTSAEAAANTAGAPTSGNKALYYVCGDDNVGLCGYELTQDLTFDKDGNGATFTESDGTYTLNSADSNATYFPISSGAGGWLPIGDNTNPFVAIFDGNGYTITGLAIKRSQEYIGMFGYIDSGAHIRNVGLVANLADSSAATTTVYLGGLVGWQDGGSITASYTTGNSYGGEGNNNSVGGLVGWQDGGSISASYTTGSANGGTGDYDSVGGLVGRQQRGSINASYADGTADGSEGNNNSIGGLVGQQSSGSITASYATGNANGGEGDEDYVGGLVGQQSSGSITASYATGNANGGGGSYDSVGGLVGDQGDGSITASYATGSANGGGGRRSVVGGLVGLQGHGSITASYATGNSNGGDYIGGLVGWLVHGSITASYATGSANGGEEGGDYIGGLVGWEVNGSITASYATGNANGGGGDDDSVGGLVGGQGSGSIAASYATGDANGGGGDEDSVGGLVGDQGSGSIAASYATGDANGGGGDEDSVGVLVGTNAQRYITASYGFGTATGGEEDGTDGSALPTGVTTLEALTASNLAGCVGIANEKAYTNQTTCEEASKTAFTWDSGTSTCSGTDAGIDYAVFTGKTACEATTKSAGTWNGDAWNDAAAVTAGAWDFGTTSQAPALRYSDYDGSAGNDYNCNQFPASVTCGATLLPGQR